jgi:hypothetical protein
MYASLEMYALFESVGSRRKSLVLDVEGEVHVLPGEAAGGRRDAGDDEVRQVDVGDGERIAAIREVCRAGGDRHELAAVGDAIRDAGDVERAVGLTV